MSLLEIERRSRRAQRNHRKRQDRKQKVRGPSVGIGHNLGPPLAPLLDDRCLTFNEWCSLNVGLRLDDIADLGREPAAASRTSDNILRDQLAENGATDAEIAILLRERVELNAMASDDLIEMIERKLREYGLQKVIPDDDLLGEAYQEFHRSKELREQFAEMESEFKESKIDVPKNLRNEVRATLKKNPDLRWDDAIQVVLDGTQLDHVRSKKQKAKKKSGDFTNADEGEGDAS